MKHLGGIHIGMCRIYGKVVAFATLLCLTISTTMVYAGDSPPPPPGAPHQFYGTVTYSNGSEVGDGVMVEAFIDGEMYNTTVVNGTYGWYTPFMIPDPNNNKSGKTIYFYVDGINTTQTAVFHNMEFTQLNLTIDVNNNEPPSSGGGSNNQGSGGSSNPEEPVPLPPVADSGGPYRGIVNESIKFNASASYDPDGKENESLTYDWNFGDGSMGSGPTPSHIYNKTGTYTLYLKVTDADGLFNTDETTVTVIFDSDEDGWGDAEEKQYGTNESDPTDYPLDTDGDYLPDSIDNDDDNDGLNDVAEKEIGSNCTNPADVKQILIDNVTYYLVDTDGDDFAEILYNIDDGTHTETNITGDGLYLLDVDGDSVWDYIYNPVSGEVAPYSTTDNSQNDLNMPLSSVLFAAVPLVLITVVVFVIYFVRRRSR